MLTNDGNDTRIRRDQGFTLNDTSWTAKFEFTPTVIIAFRTPYVGPAIFAYAASDNNLFYDSIQLCEENDQDGLMIYYNSTATVGCDSERIVFLTAIAPVSTEESIHICAGGSALLFCVETTDVGTYPEVYTSIEGCDYAIPLSIFSTPLQLSRFPVIRFLEGMWRYTFFQIYRFDQFVYMVTTCVYRLSGLSGSA